MVIDNFITHQQEMGGGERRRLSEHVGTIFIKPEAQVKDGVKSFVIQRREGGVGTVRTCWDKHRQGQRLR
jgi:hypothetical protein